MYVLKAAISLFLLGFCCCCCCVCSLSDGEWMMQGEFQVSNERIIHSIPLQSEEHVYAKFIKVRVVWFVLLLIYYYSTSKYLTTQWHLMYYILQIRIAVAQHTLCPIHNYELGLCEATAFSVQSSPVHQHTINNHCCCCCCFYRLRFRNQYIPNSLVYSFAYSSE